MRNVPLGSFQVETLDETSVFGFLFDFLGVLVFAYNRVESAFIECPSLGSAGGLHESRKVTFGNVNSGEPHNCWLAS